ncbi:telomerase reverse transcriptase isoform 1 [Galdieria sulphuraria]|uniref:Telomerase reverse transcriptase n=1 Tax=Galdieria sulphuraria TaxID=130081 RepID=M2XLQ7_GALSU|nr:telomerase reverse transcriptase isoform 1 [Galdieria sulphuraria]EME31122.1 telomerase reverse transcriptase isoform 1 [Galdieria sulphuraria]|eukprot:XP_005707642.1 telomerase reverse transcriptase isoform 1 [Galdieria sulphuraria]
MYNQWKERICDSSQNDRWTVQSILYKGRYSPLQLRGKSPILFPRLSPTISGARILYQSIFQKWTLTSDTCESRKTLNIMKKQRISRHNRRILPLLLKVIRRCRKCKLLGILKRCCPLPSQAFNIIASKSHTGGFKRKHHPMYDIPIGKRARLASEGSCKRVESVNKSLEEDKFINNGTYDAQQQQELFARLVHWYSRPRQVTRFLATLCSFIIPQQLWGATRNRNIFNKWLAQLVRLRRDDELSIQQLMQSMDLYSLPWIASKNTSNPTQYQYNRRRFYLFLRWIVFSILKPILTACFYSTDSEMFRKRILHYRVDVWRRIENLFHSSLHASSSSFQRLHSNVQLISEEESATISQLRLLPKTSGLRKIQIPIQSSFKQKGKTIRLRRNTSNLTNHVLTNIQAIMEFERRKNSLLFASCVLSLDEIYLAWLKLKREWKAAGKPHMYMAAVDISNAFDTIQLGLVTERILSELFQEDEYVILRFCATFRTHQNANPFLTKFEKVVCNDPLEESHFLLLCRNKIANKFRKAIITDQVSRIVLSRETILHVLKQRLMNNIVLFRNGLYHQKQGIPQGMTLSSRIASLYYGHFERHCLSPYLSTTEQEKEVHLSLRLVDDFLYVSSDRKKILQFLQVMNNGSPQYGLCINSNKTRTHLGEETTNEQGLSKQFSRRNVIQLPWCGLLIHCQNLEITVDYSRYFESSIYDTLSCKASESCRETLLHRAQQVFSMKFHAILIDANINSQRTIILNIFQASLLFAIKYFG